MTQPLNSTASANFQDQAQILPFRGPQKGTIAEKRLKAYVLACLRYLPRRSWTENEIAVLCDVIAAGLWARQWHDPVFDLKTGLKEAARDAVRRFLDGEG
jgi:hypothetical protein